VLVVDPWQLMVPRFKFKRAQPLILLSTLLSDGSRLLHLNAGTRVAFRELPEWGRELSIFRGV
jgi:hypothetical protein